MHAPAVAPPAQARRGTHTRSESNTLPNQHTSPDLSAARRATTSAAASGATTTANGTRASARAHLSVDGLSVSFPGRRVLTNLSFTARAGDRLGLIGENGTGKSTLLRVLAGQQNPDEGKD